MQMCMCKQGNSLLRISSAPVLPRVPSAAQMLQLAHRSDSFQEASLQLPGELPVYQGSALPQLAPDTPAPQHGVPLDLGTRHAAAPEKTPPHFEVTDADMLDALHAITGAPHSL